MAAAALPLTAPLGAFAVAGGVAAGLGGMVLGTTLQQDAAELASEASTFRENLDAWASTLEDTPPKT